jgi:predicted FMN-binding regulatory protein PaiB/GNAT superfamily N-acetyltransferase
MRKEMFRMADGEARAFLAAAPAVHLATTTASGEPVFRTVNAVVLGEGPDAVLAFHGAPAGEKMECLDRRAVVVAEETIASVPSYFLDPERACPATTLYRSVQAHGVLEVVEERPAKARALAALLAKHQPEGGHVPMTATEPLYAKVLDGLLVVQVRLDTVDGKAKLGQNRTPQEIERLLRGLWARGLPGDPRAVELVRSAHPAPLVPAFLAPPAMQGNYTLRPWLPPSRALEVAALLRGLYWLVDVDDDEVVRAHHGAAAWVGITDEHDTLVASARAVADGARLAWIQDVVVAPSHRGRGLGEAVVKLLLDHPRVRNVRAARLRTRDAAGLYERFGFRDVRELAKHTLGSIEMARLRQA